MAAKDRRDRSPEQPPPNLTSIAVAVALSAMLGLLLLSFLPRGSSGSDQVSYSEFKRLVENAEIEAVEIAGTEIIATRAGGDVRSAPPPPIRTFSPEIGDPTLLPLLEAQGVEVVNAPPDTGVGPLSWLPWLLIIGVWIWLLRRGAMGMGGRLPGGADDFLGGFARRRTDTRKRVTFADVAGQDSAKQEVAELVDFLRNPDKFTRVGAEPPRGVLLMGPPGTGKTLLARALAGEADAPFFSTSASEFIEMFVGVGASRVRRMFEEAKKRAPSIIFIDELDSVGRVRGAGYGGGHDEREQTLNQILAELDGFTGREAVVVLAATNRPDVLDPALLRPGRFDRHVTLTLPDRGARRAILDVHVRKVPLAGDVDLDVIAAGAPGFSGADLKNLVNEAAILAAREAATQVAMRHFDEARDKVMMGTVRTMAIQPNEKHRLAVHESGHTAVAWFLPEADTLWKVTIIPRGGSLGVTHMLPEEERHTLPEEYLRAQLAVLLAGRAAEKTVLGSVSSGADDDIRRATALARSMVARWGMSEAIGPVDLRQSDDHPFLGREMALPRTHSEGAAAEVDAAVRDLLGAAEKTARDILDAHRPGLDALIARLEAEETLDHDAIGVCLEPGAQRRAAK